MLNAKKHLLYINGYKVIVNVIQTNTSNIKTGQYLRYTIIYLCVYTYICIAVDITI